MPNLHSPLAPPAAKRIPMAVRKYVNRGKFVSKVQQQAELNKKSFFRKTAARRSALREAAGLSLEGFSPQQQVELFKDEQQIFHSSAIDRGSPRTALRHYKEDLKNIERMKKEEKKEETGETRIEKAKKKVRAFRSSLDADRKKELDARDVARTSVSARQAGASAHASGIAGARKEEDTGTNKKSSRPAVIDMAID